MKIQMKTTISALALGAALALLAPGAAVADNITLGPLNCTPPKEVTSKSWDGGPASHIHNSSWAKDWGTSGFHQAYGPYSSASVNFTSVTVSSPGLSCF